MEINLITKSPPRRKARGSSKTPDAFCPGALGPLLLTTMAQVLNPPKAPFARHDTNDRASIRSSNKSNAPSITGSLGSLRSRKSIIPGFLTKNKAASKLASENSVDGPSREEYVFMHSMVAFSLTLTFRQPVKSRGRSKAPEV